MPSFGGTHMLTEGKEYVFPRVASVINMDSEK